MPWEKREASDAVGIGEREGQKKKVGGLLATIRHDQGDNNSTVYELVQADGESLKVWGSTTIDNKIQPSDVGRFVKITYLGMETSRGGRQFKNIDVEFHVGDPEPKMLAWPRYDELNGNSVTPNNAAFAGEPVATEDDDLDTDLPF